MACSRTCASPAAADPELHEVGQDGGLVSAMLVYALEHDIIDAALVSYLEGDGSTWKAIPGIARNRADVIASAGSRYTYSANTLAYMDLDKDDERIALVGMSCQSSIPPVMKQRKAGKVARRADALDRAALLEDVRRRDLRGALRGEVRLAPQGHQEDEHQGRVPDLDAQRRLPRGAAEGVPRSGRARAATCAPTSRPSTPTSPRAGIGKFNDWTLTIVRTDAGRDLMARMLADGVIQVRPGDDDPDAIALMHKLSRKSRKRWPEFAIAEPGRVPPLPPKPAPA